MTVGKKRGKQVSETKVSDKKCQKKYENLSCFLKHRLPKENQENLEIIKFKSLRWTTVSH